MLVSNSSNTAGPESLHPTTRPGGIFPAGQMIPFSLVTSLFFLWGVPNNLNDILIQQFMKSFVLTRLEAGFVQFAFYMGYFLLAVPAALLMKRFSYKTGILVGLSLFAAGAFLFYPAAQLGQYIFFLIALFIIACGLAFLETASNPFIAQLGDSHSSERRLNFSQAFNPIGTTSGVLFGTIFILSGIELTPAQVDDLKARNLYDAYLRSETLRVVTPYLILGAICILLFILISRTKFPSIQSEHEGGLGDHGSYGALLRYPHFLFAVIAQFLYVGSQVGTWSYFIKYVQEATHQPEKIGGYFLTGTLIAFGVGRFTCAWIMRYIAPGKLLGSFMAINVVLLTIAVAFPGWVGLWCVFVTSFFMSLGFPTIFALGIKQLGPNTKQGGSLIIMAIVGGAVLTLFMGLIGDKTHNVAMAYLVPLVGFLGISAYGFWGANYGLQPE